MQQNGHIRKTKHITYVIVSYTWHLIRKPASLGRLHTAAYISTVNHSVQYETSEEQLAAQATSHLWLDSYICNFVCWFSINPFNPTLFLTVAKTGLPKRSGPFWSNPPFQFFDIRALSLSPEWQSAPMSKN